MKSYLYNIIREFENYLSRRNNKVFNHTYSLEEIKNRFDDRRQQYDYFHHHFWNLAPSWLRDHRNYFKKELRGFGEDAFQRDCEIKNQGRTSLIGACFTFNVEDPTRLKWLINNIIQESQNFTLNYY